MNFLNGNKEASNPKPGLDLPKFEHTCIVCHKFFSSETEHNNVCPLCEEVSKDAAGKPEPVSKVGKMPEKKIILKTFMDSIEKLVKQTIEEVSPTKKDFSDLKMFMENYIRSQMIEMGNILCDLKRSNDKLASNVSSCYTTLTKMRPEDMKRADKNFATLDTRILKNTLKIKENEKKTMEQLSVLAEKKVKKTPKKAKK